MIDAEKDFYSIPASFMWESTPTEEGGLMPSYMTVCDLYRGDPEAIWKVGLGYLTRTAFIATGIYLAGERDLAKVALYSLAGSAAVEVFVIGYVFVESGKLQYKPKLL